MKCILLYRIDFDTLISPMSITKTQLGSFALDENLTACGKINDFFLNLTKPIQLYVGQDGEVYPKFQLEETETT